jgi:uncharacterized protein (DUF1330 family)
MAGSLCEAMGAKRWRARRTGNVVLEFESYDAARCYSHFDQYQAARALREGAAAVEIVLLGGV